VIEWFKVYLFVKKTYLVKLGYWFKSNNDNVHGVNKNSSMVERLIGKSFIFQIYFNSLILAQNKCY
uniref:Uncharacterized protein n=1 Tax=Globisporangium ultimum (strain ATCC 200006 / CBS 805.95 / DAOM BR144) TaxID=431595 RepID=K3XCX9_GLOUD